MAITYKQGNIVQATERIIAHGCNAQGKMGSGVAKAIRARFPKAYEKYRRIHEEEGLILGSTIWVCEDNIFIANCITQQNYGYDGAKYISYGAMSSCINNVLIEATLMGADAVAFPRIGCALGGGDWEVVEDLLSFYSDYYEVDVVIYDFDG